MGADEEFGSTTAAGVVPCSRVGNIDAGDKMRADGRSVCESSHFTGKSMRKVGMEHQLTARMWKLLLIWSREWPEKD